MRPLLWLTMALLARGWMLSPATAGQPPLHPAVVRVVASNAHGASLGSGALIAVNANHGLVLTNWHVVRDASGPIVVAFPDGFRGAATLLKTDRDWDLAALAIQRPGVAPIPLASQPPRLGEPLTIAGYGGGSYREVTGRCTQYVSPGGNKPNEMVELSAGARFGDSGGPIFNQRGELAGVLFGSAFGQTTGSYCGRVRQFLSSVSDDFQRLKPNPALVCRLPPVQPGACPLPEGSSAAVPSAVAAVAQPPMGNPLAAIGPADFSQPLGAEPSSLAGALPPPPTASIPAGTGPSPAAAGSLSAAQGEPAEATLFERMRNFLAGVGVFAVLFHGLRLLSHVQQSSH